MHVVCLYASDSLLPVNNTTVLLLCGHDLAANQYAAISSNSV
jgi:hypothetical protein